MSIIAWLVVGLVAGWIGSMVVNRRGEVSSRLNGYVPNRFVDMLSARIEEALK